MNFRDCLIAQFAAHPSTAPQDAVKQCYQAAFGAEHLLTDKSLAAAYLEREFNDTPAADVPLCEKIAPDVGRINLAAWKAHGLPLEWLTRMFIMSARPDEGGEAEFEHCLSIVDELVQAGDAPFSPAEWQEYMFAYRMKATHAVHHSDKYRAAEHPAYRIVGRSALNALPVLERAAGIMHRPGAHVIAIDGRAASGKTTLSLALGDILGAGVVHMDDFFLPIPLRTAERYAQPGGNVHYERVAEEVLPHLHDSAEFEYRIFDCSCMDYGVMRNVAASEWRIVEGSYSFHPALGNYADLRVFCLISHEEQRARILRRNGERMARMFAERWVPLEEKYFKAFDTRESADIVLRTDL